MGRSEEVQATAHTRRKTVELFAVRREEP